MCVRVCVSRLSNDEMYVVFPHVVQFVVESTRIAHGLSVLISSPQGRRARRAVGAVRSRSSG